MGTLTGLDLVALALAAVAAGLVNALAGGGSLISFPALTAVGLAPLLANVTNTVALFPGYLGASMAQRRQLAGQGRRLRLLLPVSAMGGLVGGLLLLQTSSRLFDQLVPWLILSGSLLLAIQGRVRAWVLARSGRQGRSPSERWACLPVFVATGYGGYFGAGLGVIVLAVLAMTLEDNLTRLNGLKQVIGFSTNLLAVGLFLFCDQVSWPAAIVMACGALAGGAAGGRLAGRIHPGALRALVVGVGLVVALVYLLR
jgi:uncharacterized membrane protein YfcA